VSDAPARVQAAFAEACFGRDRAFDADLAGFLASHGVAPEDVAALVGAAPRRLALYRRLVRNNVTGVIDTMLALTRARLERHVPGELDRTVSAFLDEQGPRTPHLRDVPAELLAFAAPRWRADGRLPRWTVDHAELELSDFTIGVAPRPLPPPPLADVAIDRPLVFAEPKRLLHLGWAVNRMPREDLEAVPEERELSILVYRDGEHRSRFLELTPLAGEILDRLIAGAALGEAMIGACEAKGHALDDAVLAGAARLLADLGERGVLLGARGHCEAP
jgi:hypothetical protein